MCAIRFFMREHGLPAPGRLAASTLLLATILSAPALSAQGVNPASLPPAKDVRAEARPLPPGAIRADAVPSAKEESKAAGEDKAARPADKPADKPAPPVPHVALILPLASKAFGKVADAVKQGFLAGAVAEGRNAPAFRIYEAADDTAALAALYRKAAADGAVLIVGGITRDGANVMARETGAVPTLALNAPMAADVELPERFFHVSLSLDWEARLLARAAMQDGYKRIVVIGSATALAKRIQDSFEREWLRIGGEIALRIPFTSAVGSDSAEGQRITMAIDKSGADATLLAVDLKVARFARPYLPPGMPVYATSMTVDPRGDAVDNLDIDSVRFLEMPWFVQPDHPGVMAYTKPLEPMPIDFERLYALGIDAWRLTQVISRQEKAGAPAALDGVTGRITLEGRQFVRVLTQAEMRDGRPALFSKPAE
jgi:outer membrane PBP1 activator LpoA protein